MSFAPYHCSELSPIIVVMDNMRFTSNVLRVLAALMQDVHGQHYALDLSKKARVSVGSIYAILVRLQQHGMIDSELESIDPAAAGRPARRYYTLTSKGAAVARAELQEAQRSLSISGVTYA